jgi:hypothetical protein
MAPQYQVTLGGPGTLPGHPLFAADCGARAGFLTLDRGDLTRTMVPYYGCDRVALFQAEYRGSVGGFFGWDNRGSRRDGLDPNWVVFFDAGRTWQDGEWADFARTDSPTLYDAGIGLLLGNLGLYWAKPWGGDSDESTFTVRLGRRF